MPPPQKKRSAIIAPPPKKKPAPDCDWIEIIQAQRDGLYAAFVFTKKRKLPGSDSVFSIR